MLRRHRLRPCDLILCSASRLSLRDALVRWNSQVAIQANFEGGSLFENQLVSRLESRHGSFGGAGARGRRGWTVPARFFPFHRCPSGSDDDGLGNLFLGHSLAANFTFLADLAESMLTRNSCNRCDERHPAATSFDFLKAQDHARAESGYDGTDMPFDLSPRLDGVAVRGDQRFGQSGMKNIARLHRPGVELVGKLDESDRSLWHHVIGRRRSVLCSVRPWLLP